MKKILILTYIMVFLGSCDLITTRNPEEPNSPRTDFLTPTQPSILFQNFINSHKQKVPENYIQCFVDPSFLSDEYKFIPSAGSSAQFAVLTDWDLNSEKQFFNNLKSRIRQDSQISIQLNNEVNNPAIDSAVFQYEYLLSVPILEGEPLVYSGSVIFTIKLDRRSNWVITRWEDIKKEGFASWSELKGLYY